MLSRSLILLLLFAVMASGDTARAQAPADKGSRTWQLNWSWEDVQIDKLLDRLKSIGLEVPIKASGDVSVDVVVTIPINDLRASDKYRLQGTIASKRLRVEQVALDDFVANIDVLGGVMTIKDLQASLGAAASPGRGSLAGNATLQISPLSDLKAELTAKAIEVGPLHQIYKTTVGDESDFSISGSIDGQVNFRAPVKQLGQIDRWKLSGDVTAQRLRIGDAPTINFQSGPFKMESGEIEARQVQFTVSDNAEVALMLAAHAELLGRRRFDISCVGNDVPLGQIAAAFSSGSSKWADGVLDLNLTASGELAAGKWNVQGQVASPQLQLAGIELGLVEHQLQFDQQALKLTPLAAETNKGMSLRRVQAKYQIDETAIQLSDLDAEVFSGSIVGSANIARQAGGIHQVNLSWDQLTPKGNTGNFMDFAFDVQATTSGNINWKVAADSVELMAKHQGTANIQLEKIQLSGVEIGSLTVDANAQKSTLELSAKGNLFGGELSISTLTPVTPELTIRQLLDAPTTAQISANSIRLRPIVDVIGPAVSPLLQRRWAGSLSAEISAELAQRSVQQATIELTAENLTLDGMMLTRRVEVNARSLARVITIDRATSSYAGGRIDINGLLALDADESQLNLRIISVDASQFFLPLSESVAGQLQGRLSARLTISGGQQRDRISARGSVEFSDGRAYGVPVQTAHSQVAAAITNRFDRWNISVPSISGRVGNGRVHGNLEFDSAYRATKFDLRSDWQVDRVDFAKLMYESGAGSTSRAKGQISGRIVVNADAMSTVDDLYGNFDFTLGGSGARAIPGLTDAQNFLGSLALTGVRFEEGKMRGVISGGRANVKEFQLQSAQLMVWARGNMQLESQIVNMEAVIATGNFEINPLIFGLLQIVVARDVPALSIWIELNRILSNRTIYVDVRGPISDPRLRLKPLASVGEEAARFFLRTVLPIDLPRLQNPLAK